MKGEAIYAFVTLAEGTEMTPEVNKGLKVYAASWLKASYTSSLRPHSLVA